jgi:hypothetical protein
MAKDVVIQHKDGRRYGVKATDPRTKEAGWTIVAEADNTTPYVAPKAKASSDAPTPKAEDKKD